MDVWAFMVVSHKREPTLIARIKGFYRLMFSNPLIGAIVRRGQRPQVEATGIFERTAASNLFSDKS